MEELARLLDFVNLAAFLALALVALREWRLGRSAAARWAALAFGSLAVVVLAGPIAPEEGFVAERIVGRAIVVLLLLFPYLLFRFAAVFAPVPRQVEWVLGALALLLVAATWAAPAFPEPGEPQPTWFLVYLGVFLAHWAALSVAIAVRLWRAGGREPSVARRRMRTLSAAAAVLTLALFAAAASREEATIFGIAASVLAFLSALAFIAALAPPRSVRALWRRPEQERVQDAIGGLMSATSEQEVAARVLGPMAKLVGADAAALYSAAGRLLGTTGLDEEARERLRREGAQALPGEPERVDFESGALLVWTTPYAPFFGWEELALLRMLGDLTGLALDRARLFAEEREARAALERADAMKSNFVALAAHELRTPVAAVHGVAETLHARGKQLPEKRRAELQRLLLTQTTRLRLLVEQLLDLSRLEADAVRIEPQPLQVRERLEEVVSGLLGRLGPEVEIEVDPRLEAPLDPSAFERIVSNLVVNATRYGAPPIRLSARVQDRHFRLTVEDRGPGVPEELVPDLFERFTRGADARAGAVGTGLGLAIARSYAQAHDGDLLYERAEPRGARFELVLPVRRPAAGSPGR